MAVNDRVDTAISFQTAKAMYFCLSFSKQTAPKHVAIAPLPHPRPCHHSARIPLTTTGTSPTRAWVYVLTAASVDTDLELSLCILGRDRVRLFVPMYQLHLFVLARVSSVRPLVLG